MQLLSSCSEDCRPHQWQFRDPWVGDAALQVDLAVGESAVLPRENTDVGLVAPQQSWRGKQGRGLSWVVTAGSHLTSTNVLNLLDS